MILRSTAQDRWLHFFNNVVYDTLPAVYNAMDWLTFGVWWKLVRRALDYVPPSSKVLEIGFGPGRLHVELTQQSEFCTGLDLAWGMCRYAQHRLTRLGLASRLVQGSVLGLPYANNSFDVVVTTFAFSGFPQGESAMSEIVRVTSTGGRVVLVDIGLPQNNNRFGIFFARLWERMGDFLYGQPSLMSGAGLEVIVFEEFGPGDHIRVIVGEKRTN